MRVGASLLAQRGCLSESPSEPPEGSSPALGLGAMLFLSGSSLFRAGQQPAPVPHFPNSPSALPYLVHGLDHMKEHDTTDPGTSAAPFPSLMSPC